MLNSLFPNLDSLYPNRCPACEGRGGFGTYPCKECTERGFDPLNINLKLRGRVSPTAGVDLLNPNREKNLLIDELDKYEEDMCSHLECLIDGLEED